MILGTIKWRLEFKPHMISCKDIEHHFKQGKNYFFGYDKLNRPIIVMRVRLDAPEDVPGKLKIMIYQLERGVKCKMRDNAEQVTWLVDTSTYGFKNMDSAGTKMSFDLLHILNNYYPERLGALFVVDAPWIFSVFYNMVSPFLNSHTVEKIFFLSGKDKEKLQQHINADQLEIEYYGKADNKYNHDEYIAEMLDEEKLNIISNE